MGWAEKAASYTGARFESTPLSAGRLTKMRGGAQVCGMGRWAVGKRKGPVSRPLLDSKSAPD
jgi:hypothetical protein